MNNAGSNIDVSEDRLFEQMTQALRGSSGFDDSWRIQLIEKLICKLRNKEITDRDKAFELLIDTAELFGNNDIVSSLIRDCLLLLIETDPKYFCRTLEALRKKQETVTILSNLVMELDYKKKREAVKTLVDALANWSVEDQRGARTVYDNLLKLGKQKLADAIVKASAQYLDYSVSKLSAITWSLQLCSRFADKSLTPKMLKLLEKAMSGYFGNNAPPIYRELCYFIERTHDPEALSLLLKLSEDPVFRQIEGFTALASILDANPMSVEYVIESLYDTDNADTVWVLISALEKTKSRIDPRELVQALSRRGRLKSYLGWQLGNILARNGDKAKPILFELVRNDDSYGFALETIKRIGVTHEELYSLFTEPPMLQLYNFFYGDHGTNPYAFNKMLEKPKRLHEEIPGKKPTTLDFLVLNLFSCFNFLTMRVDLSGVDVLCFNSETMDVLVIGCTAGPIKDDLKTLNTLLDEMHRRAPDIFRTCRVTPLVISTGAQSFAPSDVKDANHMGAILLGSENLNEIVEMLYTEKDGRDLLDYLNGILNEQKASEDFRTAYQ